MPCHGGNARYSIHERRGRVCAILLSSGVCTKADMSGIACVARLTACLLQQGSVPEKCSALGLMSMMILIQTGLIVMPVKGAASYHE